MSENIYRCEIVAEGRDGTLDADVFDKIIKEIGFGKYIEVEPKLEGSYKDCLKYLNNLSVSAPEIIGYLKYLLVIVDADEESLKKRFKEIKNKFDKEKFNIPNELGLINYDDPKKVHLGVFLLPNNKDKGSMDTLAFSALKNDYDKYKKCVENFRNCFKAKGFVFNTNNQKDKFNLWSIMAGLARSKGGSQYKFLDFNNAVFDSLKDFLKQIVEIEKREK